MDDSDDPGPLSQRLKKRRRISERIGTSSSKSAIRSDSEAITIESDSEPGPASVHTFQSKEEFDVRVARLKAIVLDKGRDAEHRKSAAKAQVNKLRSRLQQETDEYRDLEGRLLRMQAQIDHTKSELLSLETKIKNSTETVSGSKETFQEAMIAIKEMEQLAKELPGRLQRMAFESKDTTILKMLAPLYQDIVQRYLGADGAAMLVGADENPPPTERLDDATKKNLTSILIGLRTKPFYHVFAHPITQAIAPRYFDIVTQPMDLSTMRAKLQADEYRSLEDFVSDAKLMFDNCRRYNGDDSFVHAADSFEQQIRHMMERRGLKGL